MSAMTKLESDVALSVQQLVDTLADARSTFREVEQFFQRALKKADRGGNLQSALLSPELGLSRQSMNDAVDAIERQRREMRHKLFALAMTEGYSIGEMGRMFGFSRQLASKYREGAGQRLDGDRRAPGRSRTRNLMGRNHLLYPVELQGLARQGPRASRGSAGVCHTRGSLVAVAQSEERRDVAPEVAGSSPVGHPPARRRVLRCRSVAARKQRL